MDVVYGSGLHGRRQSGKEQRMDIEGYTHKSFSTNPHVGTQLTFTTSHDTEIFIIPILDAEMRVQRDDITCIQDAL